MTEAATTLDWSSAEDEALVALIVGEGHGHRAQRAASELFGRYQGRVYLWCFRMVRDHDRALDLAQEAQLNAYRALPRFRGHARFSSWLFAIARNRCLADLRPVSLLRDEEAEIDGLVHPQTPADRALEEREAERALLDLMRDRLEPLERQALALRCFERVGVDEITRQLGLENATGARAILQKARRKLRAALRERDARDGEEQGSSP
jgi:RNA polymerase sigma-70 factor (ECF subfamily)